ncbi:hypothetical protein [Thermogemmatispora tikiterensis]|uniref:Uncharacterized protein n=1 Tax=Thermogemmatispora tikiterensis TaxID=1825093 RepID=A0A328VIZ7_9CHLR|nr:hypothetical protein [Thermogemmatispora tikiterensis]RAQ94255.1 hypothetical protein A4R35_01845 [Thermogemmatispora tikiterensis]
MSQENLLPLSSLQRRQGRFGFNAVSVAEGLFALGVLALLISVFLPWRYSVLNRPGEPVLVLSGWQTGLLGGQGLCLLAGAVLVLLLALRRWLAPGQRALWEIVAAVLLGAITVVTFKDVLDFYSGSLALVIKHSVLGAGFYGAMLGLDLLLFACFLLVRRRQRQAEPGQQSAR